MKLNTEPFDMIASKQKSIELRLYDDKRRQIKIGDQIQFKNSEDVDNFINTQVVDLHVFDSFEELYQSLPLLKCGYTPQNLHLAKPSDMEKYYSKDEQRKYQVVGIEIILSDK